MKIARTAAEAAVENPKMSRSYLIHAT